MLNAVTLADIVESIYGTPPQRLERIRWRSGAGPGNTHWRVWSFDRERLVLRRHAEFQTREQIEYEANVLAHLAEDEIPVPYRIGDTVQDSGRFYSLHTYRPGRPLPDDPDRQRERGRLLARIHAVNESLIDRGQRPGYDYLHQPNGIKQQVGWSEKLRVLGRSRPDLARDIDRADRAVSRELEALPVDELPATVIHCDFRAHNIHHQRTVISGVLDFDLTHLDLRSADLAVAGTPDLIAGYQEAADQPLSDDEMRVITVQRKVLQLHQIAFLLGADCLDPSSYERYLRRI